MASCFRPDLTAIWLVFQTWSHSSVASCFRPDFTAVWLDVSDLIHSSMASCFRPDSRPYSSMASCFRPDFSAGHHIAVSEYCRELEEGEAVQINSLTHPLQRLQHKCRSCSADCRGCHHHHASNRGDNPSSNSSSTHISSSSSGVSITGWGGSRGGQPHCRHGGTADRCPTGSKWVDVKTTTMKYLSLWAIFASQ